MNETLEQQLSDLTSALNAQTQALNLLVRAIGEMVTEQTAESSPFEPPVLDLSGKPIVIR